MFVYFLKFFPTLLCSFCVLTNMHKLQHFSFHNRIFAIEEIQLASLSQLTAILLHADISFLEVKNKKFWIMDICKRFIGAKKCGLYHLHLLTCFTNHKIIVHQNTVYEVPMEKFQINLYPLMLQSSLFHQDLLVGVAPCLSKLSANLRQ